MARTAKITNANVAPSRNKAGLVGNTPVRAQDFNDLAGDYVSLSDANAQSIASAVTVSGDLTISGATNGLVQTGATVTQATNHTTAVTINSTAGVIQLAAVALAAATNVEFTVTNSAVQADSTIIITVQDQNTTDNAQLSAAIHTVADGSFKISLMNAAATGATSTTASKIHFLVINNS